MKELTKQQKLDFIEYEIHEQLHTRGFAFMCVDLKFWVCEVLDIGVDVEQIFDESLGILFPEFYQMVNRVGKRLYKSRGEMWMIGDSWQATRAFKVKELEKLRTKINKL